jgi:benzoate membrane transport protein
MGSPLQPDFDPTVTATSSIGAAGLPWGNAIVAGAIAVLVGVTSSIAVVFAAAERVGADAKTTGSWIGAICIGMGVCTVVLSLRYKTPVKLAWSTPGAALIATMPVGTTLKAVTGAFLFCSLLYLITGVTGLFDRLVGRIPLPIASALLAGVLAKFALEAFASAADSTVLIVVMFLAHVVARLVVPRFSALIVLAVGVLVAVFQDLIDASGLSLSTVDPTWTSPSFDLGVIIGLGLPLYLVTMAAQNTPGVAALRTHGYDTPASPAITASGIAGLALAPFGLYSINLAAITASMVMAPDIHPDKAKRYPAAVSAGAIYIVIGVLGGSVAAILGVLPRPLIIATAAFALLPTITNGLATATSDESFRDAAIVTFLVTVSGVTIGGIGSAFWAIVAGVVVQAARHLGHRRAS